MCILASLFFFMSACLVKVGTFETEQLPTLRLGSLPMSFLRSPIVVVTWADFAASGFNSLRTLASVRNCNSFT